MSLNTTNGSLKRPKTFWKTLPEFVILSETNNLPIDYPEPSEDRDFLDQLIHEQEMLKHVYDLNVELMSPPKSLVN